MLSLYMKFKFSVSDSMYMYVASFTPSFYFDFQPFD